MFIGVYNIQYGHLRKGLLQGFESFISLPIPCKRGACICQISEWLRWLKRSGQCTIGRIFKTQWIFGACWGCMVLAAWPQLSPWLGPSLCGCARWSVLGIRLWTKNIQISPVWVTVCAFSRSQVFQLLPACDQYVLLYMPWYCQGTLQCPSLSCRAGYHWKITGSIIVLLFVQMASSEGQIIKLGSWSYEHKFVLIALSKYQISIHVADVQFCVLIRIKPTVSCFHFQWWWIIFIHGDYVPGLVLEAWMDVAILIACKKHRGDPGGHGSEYCAVCQSLVDHIVKRISIWWGQRNDSTCLGLQTGHHFNTKIVLSPWV